MVEEIEYPHGGWAASRESQKATNENADDRVSLRAKLVAECEERAADSAEDCQDDEQAYGLEETHELASTFTRLDLVDGLRELVHHVVSRDLCDVLVWSDELLRGAIFQG